MQTIIINPDRLQSVKLRGPVLGGHCIEVARDEVLDGQLEDSGGKVSPAFVVTVKGNHTDKHYRVAVTENGALKVVRL